MDAIGLLLDQLTDTLPQTRAQLRRAKTRVALQAKTPLLRNDVLLERYRSDVAHGLRHPNARLEQILTLNQIRSISGIATITVITKPYPCPGRCVYCPTEERAPKSYLTNEPAMMRAVRNDYDPYRQVISRLQTLEETGHATDKIELIIKGGTWSFYPKAYQRTFIQRCLDAANGVEAESLEEAQRCNETAAHRIIGLTIETRPDYINESEIRRLRELGATRVELGVQSLNERVLELIVRDHTTAEVRGATALLRNAGFKIAYHLMPNLPGASPTDDRETLHELFENPSYRPDAMKIYPCVVIESAELYRWWQEGRYQPYDDETLIELLADVKALVPPYVRIERVIRDIPSTSIAAGCKVTNLRETVLRRMAQQGRRCRCIRCRQVRDQASGSFVLRRRDYEASDGREVFLSFEELSTDQLAAFLRLRLPRAADHWWGVLSGAALIRELHTYGRHLSLHDRRDDAVQHRGFGRQLLAEAERIAREEFRRGRMAVIAGVGVREYYRKLGYELRETYMVKDSGTN
ncbi:MAG: tRNA uridine(34) 5-carboxymethylaminomethyl modification radical SAM/GNAT enzyme Elp3 [Candidatus Omnitrophica bacterium]|nr:tRNA uridine(34) 5-carboxymethylaminomethyl modification radical SAM/GNAT enzyme Elp3 [Candidatus Omnitrophota bacterium]